jgi:CRP-like cAMP-binding protein
MHTDQITYAYVADEEMHPDNAVIIHEGSKSDLIFVILEGRVKIKKKVPKGTVTLATLREGEILGEMAFLSSEEGAHSVSAVASGGPVRLGLLDIHRMHREYESVDPRLKGLIMALIDRLKKTNARVCELVAEEK